MAGAEPDRRSGPPRERRDAFSIRDRAVQVGDRAPREPTFTGGRSRQLDRLGLDHLWGFFSPLPARAQSKSSAGVALRNKSRAFTGSSLRLHRVLGCRVQSAEGPDAYGKTFLIWVILVRAEIVPRFIADFARAPRPGDY